MDSGSEITSIPYSVYVQHLKSQGVEFVSMEKWLDLSVYSKWSRDPARGAMVTSDLPGKTDRDHTQGIIGTNFLKFPPTYAETLKLNVNSSKNSVKSKVVRVSGEDANIPQGSICNNGASVIFFKVTRWTNFTGSGEECGRNSINSKSCFGQG